MDRIEVLRKHLLAGQVIPALPLALNQRRRFAERHQRALVRYYVEAGSGGLAVGVHATQFEIRDPRHGLLEPVLELATETLTESLSKRPRPFVRIAGLCGRTPQALREAAWARSRGYHAGLLSLMAVQEQLEGRILEHARRVAEVLPLIGFYLQPAVGGRVFSYRFWRAFMEIPRLVAVKIAPFNRYQTFDVVRAAVDAGRNDVALYTGNDDNLLMDLLTPFAVPGGRGHVQRRIVGGLLGHWGVWTRSAVELFAEVKRARDRARLDAVWLQRNAAVTDMNAAVFDAAHNFAGCVPGILETLRRQGLVPSRLCLDPSLRLSPGQAEEITRVSRAYPEFVDDDFVAAHRDRWLAG